MYRMLVQRSAHRFRVPEAGHPLSWDRAVFLNLTFWSDAEGADVLCDQDKGIAADVVTHVAWHRIAADLVRRKLPQGEQAAASAEALLFGEAIASGFDMYLVGCLLRSEPECEFVATQVPTMAEAAHQAGLDEADFASLLQGVADDPVQAFLDLYELLFDASRALLGCRDAVQGQAALEAVEGHRFGALLHHYNLSTWVLYAHAHGRPSTAQASVVGELDRLLRQQGSPLEWLERQGLPAC
jgi:hypothetical protein